MPRVCLVLIVAIVMLVPTPGSAQTAVEGQVLPLGGEEGAPPVAANLGLELRDLYALPIGNWVYLRGYLVNQTSETLIAPFVTLTLLNDAGASVDEIRMIKPSSLGEAAAYLIPPGERFGLTGATQRPYGEWTTVSAVIPDPEPATPTTLDAQATGLELFNLHEAEKTDGKVDLLGEVRNTGATTATEIEVRMVYTLADGRYIGGAAAEVYPKTLAPGETGSFAHYQAPFAGDNEWTYNVAVVGLVSAETPPPIEQGLLELGGDGLYTGVPAAMRTGVALDYLYPSDNTRLGWVTMYGEVRNTTDAPLAAPTLALTFYDEAGRVVNSRESDAILAVIAPGETVPIKAATNLSPGSWSRLVVKLGPSGPPDPGSFLNGMMLENVTSEVAPDRLVVAGEVVNTSDRATREITINVLFYGADGRFAGNDYAFTDLFPARLAPGERSAFSYDEEVTLDPGWTYRLLAEARPGS